MSQPVEMLSHSPENEQTPPKGVFQFATRLSMDECKQRLERDAAATPGFRLKLLPTERGFDYVAFEHTPFVIEVIEKRSFYRSYRLAVLLGSLSAEQNDPELIITAQVIYPNLARSVAFRLFFALLAFLMIMGIAQGNGCLIALSLFMGMILLMVGVGFRQMEREVPNLADWLHEHLDGTPGEVPR
jgi:hypothetical protein